MVYLIRLSLRLLVRPLSPTPLSGQHVLDQRGFLLWEKIAFGGVGSIPNPPGPLSSGEVLSNTAEQSAELPADPTIPSGSLVDVTLAPSADLSSVSAGPTVPPVVLPDVSAGPSPPVAPPDADPAVEPPADQPTDSSAPRSLLLTIRLLARLMFLLLPLINPHPLLALLLGEITLLIFRDVHLPLCLQLLRLWPDALRDHLYLLLANLSLRPPPS